VSGAKNKKKENLEKGKRTTGSKKIKARGEKTRGSFGQLMEIPVL